MGQTHLLPYLPSENLFWDPAREKRLLWSSLCHEPRSSARRETLSATSRGVATCFRSLRSTGAESSSVKHSPPVASAEIKRSMGCRDLAPNVRIIAERSDSLSGKSPSRNRRGACSDQPPLSGRDRLIGCVAAGRYRNLTRPSSSLNAPTSLPSSQAYAHLMIRPFQDLPRMESRITRVRWRRR